MGTHTSAGLRWGHSPLQVLDGDTHLCRFEMGALTSAGFRWGHSPLQVLDVVWNTYLSWQLVLSHFPAPLSSHLSQLAAHSTTADKFSLRWESTLFYLHLKTQNTIPSSSVGSSSSWKVFVGWESRLRIILTF